MVRIKVVKKSQVICGALVMLSLLALAICIWLMWRSAADAGAQVRPTQAPRTYATAGGAQSAESAVACLSASAQKLADVYVVEVDLSAPTAGGSYTEDSAPTLAQILALGLGADVPSLAGRSIYIYHTHTHESYLKQPGDDYVEISAYRTGDSDHSIVRVGEELARQLRLLGATVVHDATDYEQDSLGASYERSLATLEQLKGEGRAFDLWIDLHRDAYSETGSGNPFAATVNGEQVARLMVLLGTGEGTSGGQAFDAKPDFERNLVWGQRLTDALEQVAPGITRPLMVRTGRYNQHISDRCLLIEVGHNRNTLSEALRSMPYLARAVALTLER